MRLGSGMASFLRGIVGDGTFRRAEVVEGCPIVRMYRRGGAEGGVSAGEADFVVGETKMSGREATFPRSLVRRIAVSLYRCIAHESSAEQTTRRKDIPHKTAHYLSKAKEMALWLGVPLYSVVWYCDDFKEKEKQHHRF